MVMKINKLVLLICFILVGFMSFTSAVLCVGGPTDANCWSTQSPSNLVWGPNPSTTGVSTDITLSNGKANTVILAGLDGDYPAADYCANLPDGGYDWFLPSYAELWAGWNALHFDGFPAGVYWSSTEYSDVPNSAAWGMDNDESHMNGFSKNSGSALVRCLRDIDPVCPGGMAGEGNSSDPCQITNWTQLNSIRGDYLAAGKYYELMNNLNTSTAGYSGLGDSWEPIGECGPSWECYGEDYSYTFQGSFNGNGNTISNLIVDISLGVHLGLFGVSVGNISNLGLINVNIAGGSFYESGGLVGMMRGGTLSNSYSTGSISSSSTKLGGLVGIQYGGTISNSYSTANVSGINRIGGLISISETKALLDLYNYYN